MFLVLLLVLIVMFFGGLPNWGYHSYGWGPSGLTIILIIIVAVLLLRGGRL